MATQLTCPECGAVLKTGKAIADGTKVKCPKCGAAFAAGAAPPPAAAEEDTDEAPRPKPAKAKKGGNKGLLIGLIAGGGALLLVCCCGVGVAGFFIFRPSNESKIVGTWEMVDIRGNTYEFLADKTCKRSRDGPGGTTTETGTYKFPESDVVEITWKYEPAFGMQSRERLDRLRIRFDGGDLLLWPTNASEIFALRLKRISK